MPAAPLIRLVHWKEDEVAERVAMLEAVGYRVDGEVPGTSIGIVGLRANPPTAFVIDLGRLPSHGREIARSLRQSKALRGIPIVFVAGASEKVAAVRAELPDATYSTWEDIGASLQAAVAAPPLEPVVPASSSGASGKPLAKKLGIGEGATIALLDAPEGVERMLAPLPAGVTLRSGNRGRREITIWFATSRSELERRFAGVARAVGEGTLWMAWPKGSSGVATDLNEDAIRAVALDAGMVDTKVCAIDGIWSGLRLTERRS